MLVCVWICVWLCVSESVCLWAYVTVCLSMCIWEYVNECVYVWMCVSVSMSVCQCMSLCVCVWVYWWQYWFPLQCVTVCICKWCVKSPMLLTSPWINLSFVLFSSLFFSLNSVFLRFTHPCTLLGSVNTETLVQASSAQNKLFHHPSSLGAAIFLTYRWSLRALGASTGQCCSPHPPRSISSPSPHSIQYTDRAKRINLKSNLSIREVVYSTSPVNASWGTVRVFFAYPFTVRMLSCKWFACWTWLDYKLLQHNCAKLYSYQPHSRPTHSNIWFLSVCQSRQHVMICL
jgi:hypothetical protein